MICYFKKKRRTLSLFFVFTILFQIFSSPVAYALTSGPTQPEVQSFQPAGTSDMVDLFTGDFTYNIPLFELPGPNGGYPFNLSYQAGVGMDQEASWVGLGWSLQPGAVTRQMRGLPDEFKGDEIRTKMSIDPSVTTGLGAGIDLEIFGGAGSVGIGFGVYQNSYKGMGYSIDASIGFGRAVAGGMNGSLSLGLSVDSQEGVGVNPSLNLSGKTGEMGVSAAYNSKQGLTNVSLTASLAPNKEYHFVKLSRQAGVSLSFAHPSYTPIITMPMKNINISATFKLGASWWGLSPQVYVSGFYSEQWLASDKKWVVTNAFGYMNYQHAGAKDVLDFNREKDGMVSKETPNLALPSLTYDIYSVSGQGIGMMYRPMRNDYGVVYDQETTSISNAIGVGVDIAPAVSHIGINLSLNHSKSTSGIWSGSKNEVLPKGQFKSRAANVLYEPWHFKVHGEATNETEQTLTNLGGDKAMRVHLTGLNIDPKAEGKIVHKKGDTPIDLPAPANERKSRSNAVSSITNGELLSSSNQEMLSHFKVRYIDHEGAEKPFVRSSDITEKHHFAGHTALTAEGLRYVYAIPAYNTTQEEVTFSTSKPASEGRTVVNSAGGSDPEPNYRIEGTDKFLKRTVIPKYAHSHLLTSILGPDYVDVGDNGVDEKDLGYWVKFTYKKTTPDGDPYKWRDPYTKAHFQEGWKSDPRDDKGSFVYGEKEMWYLARAETKSHVAHFSISERQDGRGVNSKVQDDNSIKGKPVYQLDDIKLYTRAGEVADNPIKVTKFRYSYALCPGIENSSTNGGKLTLKNVWFEYGSSTRGSLNPYTFAYNNETIAPISYDVNAYDRWGNYKPYPDGQKLFNQDFPYANQNPLDETLIHDRAAAWSINEIKLPSGGKILVNYESDDYAYVQNKTAMQMTSIVDPYTPSGDVLLNDYKLDKAQQHYLQVRFKLERILPSTTNEPEREAEILKYIDTNTWQLYFKLLMSLRSPDEGFKEYIMGYADINKNKYDPQNSTLLRGLLPDEHGDFAYGFITLVGEDGGSAGTKMHPFAMRAWQHLRTNQPELSNSGKKLKQATTESEKINQIKSMGGIGAQIRQMFDGFYKYCNEKSWGNWVVADKSWIRLNSPDKKKFGGGIRVKQVTLLDQWGQDGEGKYGQVYDYTTTENNQTISSGVAAYEPIIGGDENALHYAKKYTQSIPMRSDNNLFFEYPVNESYYPGPQVGYSNVTVMSLPSAALSDLYTNKTTLLNNTLIEPDGQPLFLKEPGIHYGTSGKTTHEFYTAKDFPVIADETEKDNKQFKLAVTIPFLGSIAVTKLSTTQGYSIVTNDMHGKQKKVSNYRQSKTGAFEEKPISWVQYNYRSKSETRGKQNISVLVNKLSDNGDGTLAIPVAGDGKAKVDFGQEVEFFHDMRQFEDNAWGGGARINVDILYFLFVTIPVPTVWPSISKSTTQLRTGVTNKVIFRSGILESVQAYDDGSFVTTHNKKWDKLTGAAVLTTVNNNFDDLVYNYTVPAFREYQGMGAAYQNLGVTFEISAVQVDPYKPQLYQFYPSTSLPAGTLVPGDEILLYAKSSEFDTPIAKVIYTGNVEEDDMLYSEQPLTATEYRCMIVRSGYRNQLSVSAGAITALQDPSEQKPDVLYSKKVFIPK